MIEILRQEPQSNWVLLLFLFIALISVFLYKSDPKRFRYFYRSLYGKQFYINYGRHLSLSHYFIVFMSLQTILIISFISASYLSYCSGFVSYSSLFGLTFLGLTLFLIVKWLLIYSITALFNNERTFNYISVLSAQYVNLFMTPVLVIGVFLYLYAGFSKQTTSALIAFTLLLLAFAKLRTFINMRKELSIVGFYIILYLCIFEMVPFLWVLIGLNC
jgi:hypothetical protein